MGRNDDSCDALARRSDLAAAWVSRRGCPTAAAREEKGPVPNESSFNIDVQPRVEAAVAAALAPLSPEARRQQEAPTALGQLLLTCLADEAVAQHQATGAPGLMVHWPQTHAMRYVAL